MISKAVEQISSVIHHSCKKNLEKSERKVEDLDGVIKNLSFENHQLKAVYEYRVFELEQQVQDLIGAVAKKDGEQVDTLLDEDLIEQTKDSSQEAPEKKSTNILQKIIRK